MKNNFQPDAQQVALLEAYVSETLFGSDQARANNWTVQATDFGVRASMFFSGLPGYNYSVQPCWDEPRSLTRWRSYNYPHVVATYWSLYRLARYYNGLAQRHSWQWYLGQAINTTLAGMAVHGGYNSVGLMVGSVFLEVLRDAQREGWHAEAAALTAFMQGRANLWATEPFPFGSEMPWDSTGQEEVGGVNGGLRQPKPKHS